MLPSFKSQLISTSAKTLFYDGIEKLCQIIIFAAKGVR